MDITKQFRTINISKIFIEGNNIKMVIFKKIYSSIEINLFIAELL